MSQETHTDSIRLIVRDSDGKDHAVIFSDDLDIESGMDSSSDAFEKACEQEHISESQAEKLSEQLQNSNHVSTVKDGSQNFFVGMSLSEIFGQVANAKRQRELAVDLTSVSGVEGCIAAITEHRTRNR